MSEEEQLLRMKRRLEKNRESARICRQRKNQHMQELEVRSSSSFKDCNMTILQGRVHDLVNENTTLRRRLQSGDFQDDEGTVEDKNALTAKMAELVGTRTLLNDGNSWILDSSRQ